jgi:hypothetical protein
MVARVAKGCAYSTIAALLILASLVAVYWFGRPGRWVAQMRPGMTLSELAAVGPGSFSASWAGTGQCAGLHFVCWAAEGACLIVQGPRWDRDVVVPPGTTIKGTWALDRKTFGRVLESHAPELSGCTTARVTSGDGRYYTDLALADSRVAAVGPVHEW